MGLSGMVQQQFEHCAQSGDVFIFLNRQRNRIKLLHWQGDGFAVFYKRLECGTYEIPKTNHSQKAIHLTSQQMQFILDGIVLNSVKTRIRFQRFYEENVNKI